MRIIKPSRAGSLESNDVLIMLYPGDTRQIDLESPVKAQFGAAIIAVINEVLDELGVTGVKVDARDRGALDY